MQVHVSTGNHLNGSQGLASHVTAVVEDALSHFRQRITRVEVHLRDENGHKTGTDDKRCVMEARLEGRKPVTASHRGGSVDEAINAAAEKLRRLVGKTVDRLRDNQ